MTKSKFYEKKLKKLYELKAIPFTKKRTVLEKKTILSNTKRSTGPPIHDFNK